MSGPNIPGLQQPYDIPLQYFGLPTSVPANGNIVNPAFYNNGFTDLSLALTSTQNGTISTQRYLDAAGTIPQGAAFTGVIVANTPYTQNIESDGTPWQSFITTVTNSSGSVATLSNIKAVLSNSYAASNSTINVGTVDIDQSKPGISNGVMTAQFAGLPAGYTPLAEINTGPNNQAQYIGYGYLGTALSAAGCAILQLGYDANNQANRQTWASVSNPGTAQAQQALNLIFNNYASYTYL